VQSFAGLSHDSVLRVMTDDGAFRIIATRTTDTVKGAARSQDARGNTARRFGELLTAAVLFRETMAPQLRVQNILKTSDGRASVVADSHPSGKTRGLVHLSQGADGVDLKDGATLRVMRSLPGGRINQGVVEVPAQGTVSEALMAYMQTSEQVISMLTVGCVCDAAGAVQQAGGYMVQLLPEVGREPLSQLTERLSELAPMETELSGAFSPRAWVQGLLFDMPFTELGESSVGFGCWCSEVRVLSTLAALGRADIEDLLRDGEVLEIACDYCRREYRILPAQLRGLLDPS
jgi:molecular chaperone Hsp33